MVFLLLLSLVSAKSWTCCLLIHIVYIYILTDAPGYVTLFLAQFELAPARCRSAQRDMHICSWVYTLYTSQAVLMKVLRFKDRSFGDTIRFRSICICGLYSRTPLWASGLCTTVTKWVNIQDQITIWRWQLESDDVWNTLPYAEVLRCLLRPTGHKCISMNIIHVRFLKHCANGGSHTVRVTRAICGSARYR